MGGDPSRQPVNVRRHDTGSPGGLSADVAVGWGRKQSVRVYKGKDRALMLLGQQGFGRGVGI